MLRKLLFAVALLTVSPALAQEITVNLTLQEAQSVAGALSHEVQLACMFGQCANAPIAALTVPAKIVAAEKALLAQLDAEKAAQKEAPAKRK